MPFGRSSHRDKWGDLKVYVEQAKSPMPFGRSSHRDIGKARKDASGARSVTNAFRQVVPSGRPYGCGVLHMKRGGHQCLSAGRPIGTPFCQAGQAFRHPVVTNPFRQVVPSGPQEEARALLAPLASPMPFGRSSHRDEQMADDDEFGSSESPMPFGRSSHRDTFRNAVLAVLSTESPMPFGRSSHRDSLDAY